MTKARVILPTDEFFPDRYDGSVLGLEALFSRLCVYMHVKREPLVLEVFPDQTNELKEILPYFSGGEKDAAGVYASDEDKHVVVAVKASQLKDPLALVATLAHELCHVILLTPGLMSREEKDMEPMTDLATVFLGLGIFTANSAVRFEKFQDERKQGWSAKRLGYLPEPVFGYALAKFAHERRERNPEWAKHLSTNVGADFRKARKWLEVSQSSSVWV
jgi:hypothetical protein